MTTLAEALREAVAREFNPFEPNNQSAHYWRWANALAAHDAQPQKTRQDFIDGYDAGMIDGRACWKRDHDAQQQGPAISDFHNPWRTSLENCISGDNYLRASEYRDLIEELDELYRYRSGTHDAMMEAYANGRSDEHEAQQQEPSAAKDAARYRRIAWLIGSIYVHGGFKAETYNERELEGLLREVGCFWDSIPDFYSAMEAKKWMS
jgi:hypothetical protein